MTPHLTRRASAAALVMLAMVAMACGSADDGNDEDASPEGTIDGATSITSAPPEDAELLPVEEIEADSGDPMNLDPIAPGATRIRFAYGPIEITPGQNNIAFSQDAVPKPDDDGWIVRIAPNLRRGDGTVIPSSEVMLHHGVWLNTSRPDATSPRLPERIFAAGEEKTIFTAPSGYGYDYRAADELTLNYMLHNLTGASEQLYMTYDLDFIPAGSEQAADLVPTRPVWMDVRNGEVYPVFDVLKDADDEGSYTYPDDASADDPGRRQSQWTVDRDGVLVFASGHLHAGGTSVDLFVQRGDEEVQLLSSKAEYFDPTGPVSWDLAMTASPDEWRIAVREGDVLRISTTYNSGIAAWYESMGIMVLAMADADTSPDPGVDPFADDVQLIGEVTHGELPENDNHGGEPTELPDPTDLPDGEPIADVAIEAFQYGPSDFSFGLEAVPTISAGESITFDNTIDAPEGNGLWHTITSCEAPCNRSTGISYPLADGRFSFDSGQLGDAGPPTAGRLTWETPPDLEPSTYTYFCRIHPAMRGAFRVVDADS